MIYGNKAGDTIVDIYFKSGEEVEVNAFTDEGDSIPDGLADCFLAAKKNPEILTRPYPVNLIGCDTVEGIEYFFDGNAVEYYITGSVQRRIWWSCISLRAMSLKSSAHLTKTFTPVRVWKPWWTTAFAGILKTKRNRVWLRIKGE